VSIFRSTYYKVLSYTLLDPSLEHEENLKIFHYICQIKDIIKVYLVKMGKKRQLQENIGTCVDAIEYMINE
jgi:hypothetical protein